VLAGGIAALASLPLAVCALLAARTYARAAVRYRFLAVAFALAAAFTPLALVAGALRPAVATAPPTEVLLTDAHGLAPAMVRAVAVVAGFLVVAFVLDVARVLLVKRRAVRWGTAPVRQADLRESSAVFTPTAIGYVHPAVVVPAGFRSRVDAAEWEAVLAHECAHLARGDDWAKALQSLLLRAGWWLPGLWVLARALDLERELASDERAAATSGARMYAACLLRLATDRSPGLASAFGAGRAQVAIRVEQLLRPPTGGGALGRGAAMALFTTTALAVVAGALVVVPRVPARPAPPRVRLSVRTPAAPRLRTAAGTAVFAPTLSRPDAVIISVHHVVRTAWRPHAQPVHHRTLASDRPFEEMAADETRAATTLWIRSAALEADP
jgi:beta-lactamase regulating signal transducer with metallopeptidase domain